MEKWEIYKNIPEENKKVEEKDKQEYILYHNAIHLEKRESRGLDFFSPKSEKTEYINNVLQKEAEQKLKRNSKLNEIVEIRKKCYFLTQERLPSHWLKDIISFDIKKLLDLGFLIYEADNKSADDIYKGIHKLDPKYYKPIENYLKSFRRINSPNECLKYTVEFKEDYDDPGTYYTTYKPYCPEYLVVAPQREFVIKLLQERKDGLFEIFKKYKIIHPYSKSYNFKNEEYILYTEEVKGSGAKEIDINKLNPQNEKDYRLIVNILFNSSITNIEEYSKPKKLGRYAKKKLKMLEKNEKLL